MPEPLTPRNSGVSYPDLLDIFPSYLQVTHSWERDPGYNAFCFPGRPCSTKCNNGHFDPPSSLLLYFQPLQIPIYQTVTFHLHGRLYNFWCNYIAGQLVCPGYISISVVLPRMAWRPGGWPRDQECSGSRRIVGMKSMHLRVFVPCLHASVCVIVWSTLERQKNCELRSLECCDPLEKAQWHEHATLLPTSFGVLRCVPASF